MTERDFEAKLAELDRLLNDPEVRMDPDRVWTLLAEISGKDARIAAGPDRRPGKTARAAPRRVRRPRTVRRRPGRRRCTW